MPAALIQAAGILSSVSIYSVISSPALLLCPAASAFWLLLLHIVGSSRLAIEHRLNVGEEHVVPFCVVCVVAWQCTSIIFDDIDEFLFIFRFRRSILRPFIRHIKQVWNLNLCVYELFHAFLRSREVIHQCSSFFWMFSLGRHTDS